MTPTTSPDLVVADIGGTNTRVALASGEILRADTIRRYRNETYPGLESILREFVKETAPGVVAGACVAVAGPVRDGRAALTNRDWTIDAGTVSRPTGAGTVAVLNDLQAQGHAIGRIAPENLREIVAAPAPDDGDKLVIGVGTGFNCAPVYQLGPQRLVSPAEAGHANMPIRTEADLELLRFVETAHGFPAIEDVLSGRGLERIYAWLGSRAGDPSELGSAEIMVRCADGSDPRATEAARTFVRILGTVAGNLALIHLPFGGIFLVGGVSRAFTPYYEPFGFQAAFTDKGRFAGFMQNFRVTVVEDDFAALSGCAAHLSRILGSKTASP